MKRVEIVTPRLILRTPTPDDADIVQQAKLEVWDELQLWMLWADDNQKSFRATRRHLKSSQSKSPYECLLGFRRDNGIFAISTGLAGRGTSGTLTAGYWVAKSQQGQGFATEATNAQIRFAFGALHPRAVVIDYCEGNDKSASVIRKLGFTPTGTVRGEHKRRLDGVLCDVHHFVRINTEGLPDLEVSWT